ncbi:MAG: hypothetical protein SPI90_01530, partial [Fusobacterium mortiferum]|nr:hypothetical protein [Fusobacterium mortiferum]
LKDNFKNPQIKKSIVEAFIDSVIIHPNHVEIRVRDIPADMDRSGGDERPRHISIYKIFIKDYKINLT